MVLGGFPGDRGRRRGRGRGRGRTQLWEWESYRPGPDVYEQLWRIRKEPAIVTAQPSAECPIAHAQTRILDRRQTESAVVRNYYVVEIIRTDDGAERRETEEIDLSRILQYVSPAELERFENEQFGLEAEAEAVAVRAEIEEMTRRRLRMNAKGRGTQIENTSSLPPGSQLRSRGRPRGRSKRGRGRPRGSNMRNKGISEQLDGGSSVVAAQEDETSSPIIPETEDEDEILETPQPSPRLMRSAFIANSALSVSPVQRRHSASPVHRPVLDEEEDEDGLPISVAQQDQGPGNNDEEHAIKRLRIESSGSGGHRSFVSPTPQIPTEAFAQAVLFSDRSSALDLDSSPYAMPDVAATNSLRQTSPPTEEYVVEAIIDHYHDGEKMYYLVKWKGYDSSHDWLPEEDLDGARELVAEYNERLGNGKGRSRKGAFFV